VTPVALLLRAGVLFGSLALTLTTALAAADVPWVGLVALVALAGPAALRPDSWLPLVLLALHGAVWVAAVPLPSATSEWVVLLVATLLVVVQHLGAAWAAAVPPRAAVPPALLRVWTRRLGAVAGVTAAVWGIAWVAASRPTGDAAALTVLACVLLLTAGAAWWRLEQRS
jgi:hypothetical protein